jgi:hypothetical protein
MGGELSAVSLNSDVPHRIDVSVCVFVAGALLLCPRLCLEGRLFWRMLGYDGGLSVVMGCLERTPRSFDTLV